MVKRVIYCMSALRLERPSLELSLAPPPHPRSPLPSWSLPAGALMRRHRRRVRGRRSRLTFSRPRAFVCVAYISSKAHIIAKVMTPATVYRDCRDKLLLLLGLGAFPSQSCRFCNRHCFLAWCLTVSRHPRHVSDASSCTCIRADSSLDSWMSSLYSLARKNPQVHITNASCCFLTLTSAAKLL